MARLNKWKQYLPQQEQQNEESKPMNKKIMKFSDQQAFQVSTHDSSYKDGIDIEISEDLIATCPVYLEISVRDQAIKFIVQVTQVNLLPSAGQKISVLKSITDLYKVDYDVNKRFQAYFRVVNEQEKTYQLAFVEILVKEHFLSRRDMVQINNRLLKTTCYTKKNVQIGWAGDNLKAQITISQLMMRDINNQEYAYTGIITEETNIVYRSLEAKVAILIEVSQETFLNDAIGEISLESMQKFLKVYYMRNQLLLTNHKLEIIIYARIYFPQFETVEQFYAKFLKQVDWQQESIFPPHAQLDQFGKVCMDIYKKVPERRPLRQFDQLSQTCIQAIQELTAWINVRKISNYHTLFVEDYLRKKPDFKQVQQPRGKLSSSKKCNLLEALTLVTQNFRQDHATRSLRNSGHLILILSPGNGYFFGDLRNYKIAKRNALNNNIVCMLNCFGRIPNITGPMFYLSEHELPIESQTAQLTQDQKLYFRNHTVYLNQVQPQITQFLKVQYQDRSKITGEPLNSYLRHAYWIQIIKYNDEFLRSFFILYDRQNQNDLLPFCFKKQKNISFSQADFTLLDYFQPKKVDFSTEFDQEIDDCLLQSLENPLTAESQLRKQQMGSIAQIEDTSKPYIAAIDTSAQPNIFLIPVYEKKPDQQEHSQPVAKVVKNQKKKLKSHNRVKWKLYQWGWKSHQFLFQMKEAYHKHFKNYLLNHAKDPEQNLFLMEQNWKNICYVPLCPLKTVMVYEELQNLKPSGVYGFVDAKIFTEFEDQVMGILLAENYQFVQPGEQTEDEYGSKLQCYKNQSKNIPVKFIKGGHIVTLHYNSQTFKYSCEEYYKKKPKPETMKHRYIQWIGDSAIVIPILYRYNLHGSNNSVTCREILFSESLDTDVKALIQIFSESQEYTIRNIQKMRPKNIGLAYIPNESLSSDKLAKQNQYVKWMDNFNKFMDKLKQQIRCFNQDNIKLHHFMKRKQMIPDQYNYFSLKYSTDLPEYKTQLHNERYEQVCITSQINYCPKCIYNINLTWISSSALQIAKVIKIMEMCSQGFTQIQIPGSIENIFAVHLPFESILKFRLNNQESMKYIMQKVRESPFDCFYDGSTQDHLLVHRKGLFFLKFDMQNLEILFKENCLYAEEQTNAEVIQNLYKQLKALVNDRIDKQLNNMI